MLLLSTDCKGVVSYSVTGQLLSLLYRSLETSSRICKIFFGYRYQSVFFRREANSQRHHVLNGRIYISNVEFSVDLK